jgi:ppGpp synthetase/RelA/SpoT-type nucleotidyltranferase
MGGDEAMNGSRTDEWGRKYMEKYSLYEEFAGRISNLLQNLVEGENIEVYSVFGRAKTPEEFLRTAGTPPTGEQSVLAGIADLCTVKILVSFPDDVAKVEDIVQKEFLADMSRSIPLATLDSPERYGYPAVSYVLSLNRERAALREWAKYRDLPFTLEIRTVLQEAWAANAPKVSLPTDTATKKKMQRKLLRLSALLEEADEGFLSLLEAARESAMPVTVPSSPEPAPFRRKVFDRAALKQYFDERGDVLRRWSDAAVETGFPPFVSSQEYLETSLSYLWDILRAAEMDSMEDLDEFLRSLEEEGRGEEQISNIFKAFEKEASAWKVDGYSALFLLVLNLKWEILQQKDLVELNIKKGSDRIKGVS